MPASHDSTRFSTAREIALAFGGSGTASASGWHDFRCPARDDKTASSGVKDERDGKIAHQLAAQAPPLRRRFTASPAREGFAKKMGRASRRRNGTSGPAQ